MKKVLIITIALLAFYMERASAQNETILTNEFWEAHPDLASVKAEVKKGFDFKNLQGMEDPLVLAIRNNASADIIKYLTEQPGIDLSRLVHEGRTYLHMAAYAGNADAVNVLLDKGLDMYQLDSNGHTALTYSGYQGKLTTEVIDVFLKHGLDIHKKYENKDGADILLLSVPYDKGLVVTNYLISKGLSIKVTDDNGNTAFNWAAQIGDLDIMKALLKKGATYNANALVMASKGTYRSANTIDVFTYLVDEMKIDPKVTDVAGKNVLHFIAQKRNQEEVVKYFLAKGVDVNQVDEEGNTPFMVAAGGQSFEVVKQMFPFVNKGKINKANAEGKTALLLAVEKGVGETVSFLLENNADVKVKDNEGNTLAYYLIQSYPVERGGRNGGPGRGGRGGFRGGGGGGGRPNTGASPQESFTTKLNALKNAGLNFSALQNGRVTIYHLAATKNDLNLLKSLEGLKVDVNVQDAEGTTALHRAAMVAENDQILKYLLSIGAKKDIKTAFDDTAYSLAKENELLAKNNISIDFLK